MKAYLSFIKKMFRFYIICDISLKCLQYVEFFYFFSYCRILSSFPRSGVIIRLMYFLLFYSRTSSSLDCLEFQSSLFSLVLESVCNDSILKRNYRLQIQIIDYKFSRQYYFIVIEAKLNLLGLMYFCLTVSELNVLLDTIG